MEKCKKIGQVLERIEKIFSEIREIVYSLRSEEERSHRKREKVHYKMLEELRMIRKTLEKNINRNFRSKR